MEIFEDHYGVFDGRALCDLLNRRYDHVEELLKERDAALPGFLLLLDKMLRGSAEAAPAARPAEEAPPAQEAPPAKAKAPASQRQGSIGSFFSGGTKTTFKRLPAGL